MKTCPGVKSFLLICEEIFHFPFLSNMNLDLFKYLFRQFYLKLSEIKYESMILRKLFVVNIFKWNVCLQPREISKRRIVQHFGPWHEKQGRRDVTQNVGRNQDHNKINCRVTPSWKVEERDEKPCNKHYDCADMLQTPRNKHGKTSANQLSELARRYATPLLKTNTCKTFG